MSIAVEKAIAKRLADKRKDKAAKASPPVKVKEPDKDAPGS